MRDNQSLIKQQYKQSYNHYLFLFIMKETWSRLTIEIGL
jgi:hypothetical protein